MKKIFKVIVGCVIVILTLKACLASGMEWTFERLVLSALESLL